MEHHQSQYLMNKSAEGGLSSFLPGQNANDGLNVISNCPFNESGRAVYVTQALEFRDRVPDLLDSDFRASDLFAECRPGPAPTARGVDLLPAERCGDSARAAY